MCPPMWALVPAGEYDWTRETFGKPQSTTQTANQSVQLLLHSSWQKIPILNNGKPFPKNFWFSLGDWSGPPYNSWLLGPVRAHNPNGITISGIWTSIYYMVPWSHTSPWLKRHLDQFSHFAGLTSVTDRLTDHATRLVTIDRIYLRSTGDVV